MNQHQIDLIDDPPPKSPYFTLPDTQFFVTPEDIRRAQPTRPAYTSLIDLFGQFDKMSDDQQTQFILTLLQHSSFKPDYEAMAKALNLANATHVRRRLAAIAEKQGFHMEGDRIKPGDSSSVITNHRQSAQTSDTRSSDGRSMLSHTPQGSSGTASRSNATPPGASSISCHQYTAADLSGYVDAADIEDNAD